MTEKRFIEFMTQSTDTGELNCGFYDAQNNKYYYTKDGENSKGIVECLNNLHEEKEALELDNKLLLEEMKEIRDKLTVYLKVKGIE